MRHEFVAYDDDTNVWRNPALNPPTWPRLRGFWQQPYANMYIPVTYSVWTAVALVADMPQADRLGSLLNPYVFHTANLLVHIASVLVVWVILNLLVRHAWAAAVGALLFALHPVQVEPVAWVTGMKDLLCGLLSLLAIWQYLLYAGAEDPAQKRSRWAHYAVATAALVLALLSKPAAVTLPVIAWILSGLLPGRNWRTGIAPLLPWVAIAAVSAAIMVQVQPPEARVASPLWARPLVASDTIAFYLYKLLYPARLGMDYGRTPQWLVHQPWVYFAWLVPAVGGAALWWLRTRTPVLPAAAGVFVASLLPVLGLKLFDYQEISTVADRYLYLAMLAPALAMAWWLSRYWTRARVTGCIIVLCILGTRSWFQTWTWRDTRTLLTHAVWVNPSSWTAHRGLVTELMATDLPAAIEHGRAAVRSRPDDRPNHDALGLALLAARQYDQAIAAHREAMRVEPDPVLRLLSQSYLARALARSGRLDQAIEQYRAVLSAAPDFGEAQRGLAEALREQEQRKGGQ